MKFNDGYWKRKDGVIFATPTEIREISGDADCLTIYTSNKPVPHLGETTNTTLIKTELFSPAKNVIGVRHTHWEGGVHKGPAYDLNITQSGLVTVQTNGKMGSLDSAGTKVEVSGENGWTLRFSHNGRHLTGTTRKDMGYISIQNSRKRYIKEQLSLGVGECVYGLGERFSNFVKNGQVIDLWNADGGTSSEQAYKNVPFYLTSNCYGVFINHPELVSVEAASEVVTGVGFSVEGESLEYYVIGGDTLKEVLIRYTALTGKPALPPAWSFGLWLTPSFSTEYTDETIREFIHGMKDRDIPLRVFQFDSFYQKEYQFCDFAWDPARFSDPQGLLDEMDAMDLKAGMWMNPYVAQKSPLFAEGVMNGYFLKYKDGSVYQDDWWMPGMAILDVTNPEARAWYTGYLEKMMNMGISCFKTDFGEVIPVDVVFSDGSDAAKMHNYYSFLYNKMVFEAVEKHFGKGQGLVFARSGTAGSQRYPLHWAGDSYSSYPSMAETLRGGLSLAMSGFSFWSHDISGFEKTATPDLYKRWCAFGLLSSHSRLHGSESYRVPWLFGEEAVDVLRLFTKLKYRLMPYIFAKACEASETGLPVLRPMILEFCEDYLCRTLDTQYMLGDALLVAPVFNEEGEATYYVPKGEWTNLLTGEQMSGGRMHQGRFDYFSLPLLAGPNTVLPMGSHDDKPDYDYADNVAFHVYNLGSQGRASVYSIEGSKEIDIILAREDKHINVVVQSANRQPYALVIYTPHDISLGGHIYAQEDGIVRLNPDPWLEEYQLTLL